MQLSLNRFNQLLLVIIIFLLPFTGVSGFSFLGELQNDASAHFILFICIPFFFLSVFINGNFKIIKNNQYLLLLLFVLLVSFSSVVSISSFGHVFKGKNGYEKFILQYGLLIFYSLVICHFFYNIFTRNTPEQLLFLIRKAVLASFVVVLIYAFFEIIHLYGVETFTPLLEKVDWLIRSEPTFSYLNLDRIRSVTPEPPFLTLYLVFATPWLLSYFFSDPGKYYRNWAILTAVLMLVYFSGSRSGLVVITFEILLFFALQFKFKVKKQRFINVIYLTPIFTAVFVVVGYLTADTIIDKIQSISVNQKSELQVSSISRWSTQEAAMQIALDNPFFGVGFGQQGYYFPSYYSKWAYERSYEIRNWSDSNNPTWPPGFSMFTRLAAETGIFNALFFFFINFLLLYKLVMLRKKMSSNAGYLLLVITSSLLASYILIYLQIDTFRLTGYWLTIPLAFILLKNEK